MRVGIYGGSFNPPHLGHINALQAVVKKAGLEKVHVIPAALNPLKLEVEGPTPEQRCEMTRLAFADMGPAFFVDDREIKRGGTSYTIDTIKELRKEVDANDLFLIIGADVFESFDQWRDYSTILKEANLIVTSRPGWELPSEKDELPAFIQERLAEFDFNFLELNTGRSVQFLRLKDVEISASDLRKWMRVGRRTDQFLPLSVEGYIRDNGLYAPLGDRIGDYQKFTEFCAHILFDKKGINVRAFDLRKMTSPSEFTVIASGTSTRHASSLGENLMRAVKEEYNVFPQSIEGVDEGRWVLLDYGSLIVHLFYDFVRQEYNLESLWRAGTDLQLKDPTLEKGRS